MNAKKGKKQTQRRQNANKFVMQDVGELKQKLIFLLKVLKNMTNSKLMLKVFKCFYLTKNRCLKFDRIYDFI